MDLSIFNSLNLEENIIIQSGEKYYLDGNIKEFDINKISGNNLNLKGYLVIEDKVFSSEVILDTKKNKIINSFCSCDESGGFCAHRVSLIYQLFNSKKNLLDNDENIDPEKYHSYKRDLSKIRLIKSLYKISEKYSVKVKLICDEEINEEINFKLNFYKDDKVINFYTDISYMEKWDEQRRFNYTMFPLKDRLIVKSIKEWVDHIPEEDFSLPKNKVDLFMKILSDFPELYDDENNQKINFEKKYYKPNLIINLNKNEAFINIDIQEDYKIISGMFYQWILLNNKIMPLRAKLREDIWYFLKNDKIILHGNEIATFYYEIYPKIKNSFNLAIEGEVGLEELEDFDYILTLDYQNEITISAKISIPFDDTEIIIDDFPFSSGDMTYLCRFHKDKYYIIKRNLMKERKILFLLKKFNFIIKRNKLVQKDKLYYKKFLEEGPKLLKTEAKVEFTDEFKKIMLEKVYILSDISIEESVENKEELIIDQKNIYSDGSDVDYDTIKKIISGKRFINIDKALTLVENYQEIKSIMNLIDSLSNLKKIDNLKKKKKVLHISQLFYFYDEYLNIEKENKSDKVNIILSPYLEKMISFREKVITKQDISMFKKKVSIPQEVTNILRNYQKYGFFWFHFLKEFHFGGILADDMGLGKTIQILTFIKSLNSPKPSLIACPTSLMHNWSNEIDKFFPSLKKLIIKGNINERKKLISHVNRYDVIITSYSLIRNDIEQYEIFDFEVIVLDEANHIKNPNTKISTSVKKLNSSYKYVLTGTPVENNLKELWSIFSFVSPQLLGKFKPFKDYFVDEFNEDKAIELKQKIGPFILRRNKSEVLTELPPKIIQTSYCDMTSLQQNLYDEILDEVRESVFQKIKTDGLKKSKIHILTALLKLRQVANHPSLINQSIGIGNNISGKIDQLRELLIESTDAGHKILIFSSFTKMLNILKQEIDQLNLNYSYLDGSLSEKQRQNEIEKFKKPETDLFLISLKAGGYGLNLTEADTVIIVDPWWNPMVEMQAIDRAYRMGQKRSVNVYKLITTGSIEERILKLQNKKKQLFDSVVNVENIFTSLTEEDIEDFFN